MTTTELWPAISSLQGRTFLTAKGLPFSFTVRGNELFISRKDKSITRATVELAYRKAVALLTSGEPVDGPKKLGTFGASYLYPLFIALGIIEIPLMSVVGQSESKAGEVQSGSESIGAAEQHTNTELPTTESIEEQYTSTYLPINASAEEQHTSTELPNANGTIDSHTNTQQTSNGNTIILKENELSSKIISVTANVTPLGTCNSPEYSYNGDKQIKQGEMHMPRGMKGTKKTETTRKPYPGVDARIAMADQKIERLTKLNASRAELIAQTEAKLAERKATLAKSEAQLEKAKATRERLLAAKDKPAKAEKLSPEERKARRLEGQAKARAAKKAEKEKYEALMAALAESGKTVDELLDELKK